MLQLAERNQDVARVFDQAGADDPLVDELLILSRKYHIREVMALDPAHICTAHWVSLKCEYGCNKYGTSWCCPPKTPTLERAREILGEYKKAFLLCSVLQNSQFQRDNHQKRRRQVSNWKGTVALERHLFLAGYYKAFGLVSETCALCKQCAYPEPCKFPMYKRPSVESFSIDMFQTIRNIGRQVKICHDVKDEYDCYSLILLE